MKSIIIVLPTPDPRLHAHAKGHWRPKAKATKELRYLAKMVAGAEVRGMSWPAARVRYRFFFADHRRRDEANAIGSMKAAIDGVVDAGLIPVAPNATTIDCRYCKSLTSLDLPNAIVIDADEDVCCWWDSWRRSKEGRSMEVHHCNSIEWLWHRFGLTEYSADPSRGTAATDKSAAEHFVFCDPPYVLSQRSHGKLYDHELTDDDHDRLLRTLTAIDATSAGVMLCGYTHPIYASVDRDWSVIDHHVPTRGGLQSEKIWMNFDHQSIQLHDYQYLGDDRRSRERIRRRQNTWRKQLMSMPNHERAAMIAALQEIGT